MTIYTKGIRKTSAVDGAEIFEIFSTEEETKRVNKLKYTDIKDGALVLNVLLEREKIMEAVPLKVVAGVTPEREFSIDIEIPVGQSLRGVITPEDGSTDGTFIGYIEYEITV